MKRIFILTTCILSLQSLHAQESPLEDALMSLLDNALRINIVARILPQGERPVFNVSSSKLTLPGRPVAIQFQGKNILIIASLTPYRRENGNLTLLAQGQIWLQEPATKEVMTFQSSVKSLPVSLGQKILFLPLGVPEDLESGNFFNIELEIEIVPFRTE
jgi:hypothetical protein